MTSHKPWGALRWLRTAGICLGLCAFVPGCVAHARGTLVYDHDAEYVDAAPERIEYYPRTYYRGEPAYLVDGRWYYRSNQRWVVFHDEPRELRDYRVRSAPAYLNRPGYAPPRQYDERRTGTSRAELRRDEARRDEARRDEARRDAEHRADVRRMQARRAAEHRADVRREEERRADARRAAEHRDDVRRAEQQRAAERRADDSRVAERRARDSRKRDPGRRQRHQRDDDKDHDRDRRRND